MDMNRFLVQTISGRACQVVGLSGARRINLSTFWVCPFWSILSQGPKRGHGEHSAFAANQHVSHKNTGNWRVVRDSPSHRWVRISALSILYMVVGIDH